MTLFKSQTWIRAALLTLPVVAIQIAVSQVQTEYGLSPLSSAVAQEEKKKQQKDPEVPWADLPG